MSGKHLFCIVPGLSKAQAVKLTLEGEVTQDVPATALRMHSSARMFIDSDAASELAK